MSNKRKKKEKIMLDIGQKKKGILQKIASFAGYFGIATCVLVTAFMVGWLVWAIIIGGRTEDFEKSNDTQEKMLKNIYNRQIIADQKFENQIEELERLLNDTRALQTLEHDSISLEHQSFLVADPDCPAPTCQWGVNASGYCVNDLTVNMPDGTPCSSNCYWNSTSCSGGECQSQFCKGNCENNACPTLSNLPSGWFAIPNCVATLGGNTLPGFISPVYGCVYTISSNSILDVLLGNGVPSPSGVQCGATTQAICEQVIPDEYKDCMEVTHTCAQGQGVWSSPDSNIWSGCQAHFKCTNFFPSV